MILPLGTNRPARRPPVVTGGLLLANLGVYLAMLVIERAGGPPRDEIVGHLMLAPESAWWTWITYAFMHDPGAIWHLAFNLVFLWVFGAAVESRFGRLGFLGFYLAGAVLAGLAQRSLHPDGAVIGASGAVSAVTGAFLALFPRARVRVIVVFFLIGVYELPALWLLAFYFAADLLNAFFPGRGVAYAAHLAGYLWGFGLSVTLLAAGILGREEFDVFYLWKQSRRRAAFRRAVGEGPGTLFDAPSADTGARLQRSAAKRAARKPDPAADARAGRRAEIVALVAQHRLDEAAEAWLRFERDEPVEAALPEGPLLDVANRLAADGRDADAARAYARLLERHPRGPSADQVRLMLSVLLVRRLDRAAEAKPLLETLIARLREGEDRSLAEALRREAEIAA